ncbi:MAG: AAA domain-containing protein, partial [Deltaproteobacteria bacterium]
DFYAFLAARIQASEPAIEVAKIDRPRIQLVHSLARRRLDQYRRRVRLSGRGVRTLKDIDYSYEPENFHPLGLALFRERIRPPVTNVRTIIEDQPRPRSFISPPADSPVIEKERSLYALTEDVGTNPYHWEFDLCNVTLGSFRYRKLSLVRDYAALLEDKPENPACEAIFSRDPRPVEPAANRPVALADRFDVVPCDPTQATAIARARAGTSYIIQGPPGTGKSQTITNLIADFVGRGKRVLFVCEKRAAIDVVYHRLCSTGLHPLCCLIHDSQLGKRDFVLNLKETYEAFLDETAGASGDRFGERKRLVADIERAVGPLQRFHDRMCSTPAPAGTTLRKLLHQAVKLRHSAAPLAAEIAERVPAYAVWCEHAEAIGQFSEALSRIQPDGVYVHHPLRRLSPMLLGEERPVARVARALENVGTLLGDVEALLKTAGPASAADTLAKAAAIRDYVERVAPLAERDLLSLVERGSAPSKRLDAVGKKYRTSVKNLQAAASAAAGWTQPLPPTDAATALEQARALEKSWFAALRPGWWRLRRILHAAYDFRAHTVRPSWSRVLTWLCEEHAARAAVAALESEALQEFGGEEPLADFLDTIARLRKDVEMWPAIVRDLHRHCLESRDGGRVIAALGGLKPLLEQLRSEMAGFLEDFDEQPIAELRHELGGIGASLQGLPDFLHCLASLEKLPADFRSAVRALGFDLTQLESASAERTLQQIYRADRELDRFDGRERSRHVDRLDEAIGQWREVNAAVVCESVRRRFLDNVRIASLPAAQLERDQKEFKKQYQRGRRELEHEFGKTMRYRSIRDLASGDPGLVVRDLKPVWLMSPLSVSDTLPLDTRLFDVVIFDEASQITLEEAVPSVFRGVQTIVVGDRMQLPPTNFFSARQSDEEEPLQVEEETGQVFEYDLSSDSLLEHASRNLSSTMLGWHYRSRSESLISFSNAAFYQGKLLTVPEESLASSSRAEIVVGAAADGAANVERLFDRAVSFHFLPKGVYQRRKNADEADYVARLVRAALVRRTGKSIGIVAFSEAQQTEIEEALDHLSRNDREFRELYEAELEREENDQFLGLLVKNLENIQGDERDVVILSICYGYDASRRMLMNFGPINQSGGEKRLNVAFSRARHHMAVVSSIRPHDITNEYNDGANCLRNYLRYAEATSAGDFAAARRVLAGFSAALPDAPEISADDGDAVADQLAAELTGRGYRVDRRVGQSMLRCDLAVCRPGDEAYRLGILVDTDAFYRHPDLLEKNLLRPRLLEEFGWKIAHVLTKDWHRDPKTVLDSLLQRLEGPDPRDAGQ